MNVATWLILALSFGPYLDSFSTENSLIYSLIIMFNMFIKLRYSCNAARFHCFEVLFDLTYSTCDICIHMYTIVYICDCSSQVDSHFLMNSILESADPGRVNGFLAAFPDRGFGTAEFFSVPWPFWPKRAFPGDGLEVSGRRVPREFRNDFWENSHGRSQEGNKKIHKNTIRIFRIHNKNT